MAFKEKTINEFVSELKSKAPTPGGGGGAALVGALGISLGNMVGSLTVGKKKYAEVEDEIKELMVKAEDIIDEFLALIDKDAEAFEPLAKAYSLPKETDEEKAYKAEVLAQATLVALEPPMTIMRTCCKAIDIVEEFAAKGSRLAISDAGCAAALLRSALLAASLNVYINTGSMADTATAAKFNEEADEMIKVYGEKAENIFNQVKDGLKK